MYQLLRGLASLHREGVVRREGSEGSRKGPVGCEWLQEVDHAVDQVPFPNTPYMPPQPDPPGTTPGRFSAVLWQSHGSRLGNEP